MIIKVAWRNIWRNKVRSTVVILAIAIGLWAGLFSSGFVLGMMDQKVNSVIELEISHFQFHHPEFRNETLAKYTIPNSGKILQDLSKEDVVKGVSERVIATPMISTPDKSGSIRVTGISPKQETSVTTVYQHIISGDYFDRELRNPILLSTSTADEYGVKVRSKVVLTTQDTAGNMTKASFKVVGLYDTDNPMYDKMNAFVLKSDLQEMLGIGDNSHEIAVLLSDHDQADPMTEKYDNRYQEVEVKSWKDLSVGMRFMIEAMDTYTLIIVGIILVALLFSIVNTMLMAVLERVREIGMLMAIGMTRRRVFVMILMETVFLTLIGGPIGLLLAGGSIEYFGVHGIDLGDAAYGEFGWSNLIFPRLGIVAYFQVTIMVFLMALLASIYPARKALRLNPAEAIRKI